MRRDHQAPLARQDRHPPFPDPLVPLGREPQEARVRLDLWGRLDQRVLKVPSGLQVRTPPFPVPLVLLAPRGRRVSRVPLDPSRSDQLVPLVLRERRAIPATLVRQDRRAMWVLRDQRVRRELRAMSDLQVLTVPRVPRVLPVLPDLRESRVIPAT